MRWLKRLCCTHNWVEKSEDMPRPFNHMGYPVFDENGFWLYDTYLHECDKCGAKEMKALENK